MSDKPFPKSTPVSLEESHSLANLRQGLIRAQSTQTPAAAVQKPPSKEIKPPKDLKR